MPNVAQCVAWNPQGTLVATGIKRVICTFGIPTTRSPWQAGTDIADAIVDVAWSPDGRQLATSSVDDTTRIWNVADGSLHQVLQGHFGPVWSVDWNPEGDRLATSSRDGTVRIWEPVTGKQVLTLRGIRQTGEFWCVRWSPDGQIDIRRKRQRNGYCSGMRHWAMFPKVSTQRGPIIPSKSCHLAR